MSQTYRPAAVVLVMLVAVLAPATGSVAAQTEDVTLTLEVVNDAGETVSGVALTVDWEGGSETVTTRASGQALVDVPSGSNATVTVSHDIYMRNFPYDITNATGGTVRIPVSRTGSVDVTVQGQTGPVEDATVRLVKVGRNAATAETGGDGTITVGPVERGEYGLVVEKPGHVTNASTVEVTGAIARTVELQPGAVEVRFQVTDDHFSPPEPVEDARVSIEETNDDLATLENGQRVTTVPVNRQYSVTVRKDGYRTVERDVRVGEESRTVDLTINRVPDLDVELVNRRVVVGESTILTATNEYGEPVAGAEVTLDGDSVGTTDEVGELTVSVEARGNRTVEVSADGLSNSTEVEGIQPATRSPTPTTTTPTTTTTVTETASVGGPGFTVWAALLALFAFTVVAVARRRG